MGVTGRYSVPAPPPPDLVARNWQRQPQHKASLPEAVDVTIIGAGIVGITTAWQLARRGLRVLVCEKGRVAGEQSGRNWGWVRQQGRDPRELPMMIDSRRQWETLEEDIGEEVGFQPCGCLFMARNDEDLAGFESWLSIAREHELDTRILRGRELDDLVAGGSHRWAGALYTASDCRAEPHKAVPAIARAAVRESVVIREDCAVRGIEAVNGAVAGVVTEAGRVRSPAVLCAAGAWTSYFCRSLGIDLPQLRVRGTVARTAPAVRVLDGCLFDERIGIRRRQDGGYTVAHGSVLDHPLTPATFRYARKFLPALRQEWKVLRLSLGRDFFDELRMPKRWSLDAPSPFESRRILNPAPNPAVLRGIEENLAEVFPSLAGVPLAESWAGIVETTPDVLPVIDQPEDLPGFWVATGLSGHGFGIGPGVGRLLADLLTGQASLADHAQFRLSRFFDGSPIRPMKSV